MKSELEKRWRSFVQFCKANKKTTLTVFCCIVGILLLQNIAAGGRAKSYVSRQDGKIAAIVRENVSEAFSVPLRVKAVKGKSVTQQEIILSFSAPKDDKENEDRTSPEDALSDAVHDLIRELEQSSDATVSLPEELADGTKLSWYRDDDRPSAMILLLFPLIMLFLKKNEDEKLRKQEKEKLEQVKLALPSFNNQLLLLLGSGLIFYDAFKRIASGYEKRQSKSDYFRKMIIEIMKGAEEAGADLPSMLSHQARTLSIREFSRITGIILDNQYKGVNLTEKLENESELLWNQRKKLAEERGRIAETKLTFPLVILLVVLILVTAAPAIMEI